MNRYAVSLTVLFILFLKMQIISAQEFIGLRTDNYSGSNGMLFNPAAPIAGKLPYDVNIFSFAVNEDNNYISISDPFLKYISSSDSILDINYFNPHQIYAHGNVLMQLPSAFVKVNDAAFGFFSTIRTAGYFLSDKQSEGITGLKDIPLYTPTDMPAFNAGALVWGEVGVNGEFTLERNSLFSVFIGGNLKYLMGFEALGFENNTLFTFTKDTANMSISYFDSDFDYTRNLGSNLLYDPSNYALNGNGIGMDFGMYYVIHEKSKFKYSKHQNYTWKFGGSLLDFGVIKFKKNAGSYHLEEDDPFVVANMILDSIDDIDEFNRTGSRVIYDNSDNSRDADFFSMFLPAAFTLTADHAFRHHIYVQAMMVRRIPRFDTNIIARANVFGLTPRYETRTLGITVPMSLYEDKEFKIGLAARLWMVTIGSDNLLTFFTPKEYSSIDMYVGFKFNPFWLAEDKKKKILECLKW